MIVVPVVGLFNDMFRVQALQQLKNHEEGMKEDNKKDKEIMVIQSSEQRSGKRKMTEVNHLDQKPSERENMSPEKIDVQ